MTVTADTFNRFDTQPISLSETDVTLREIVKSLPQDCFQKVPYKAWSTVVFSVAAATLGYVAVAYAPWFLLPIAWVFLGTALTGFFVIAHDCGHRSFSRRLWVNDWLGHILLLPLIYPFHCWRLLHDRHHLHTNKLYVDNAWQPWTLESYAESGPFMQGLYRSLRGPFWWTASIIHWAALHFNLAEFHERDRAKAKTSILTVLAFSAIFFPVLGWATGIWGIVKFWLMPWLVYHFWMSTFTLVHHAQEDIPFHPADQWHEAEAQLAGTLHCDYPRWVEVLCHDINVHVPHHISVAIPSYNLRLAYQSLQQNWGPYLREHRFSVSLMRQILSRCRLYDPKTGYRDFPR